MRTQLKSGVWFITYQDSDTDEVYGWFESGQNAVIKGSGGWWRTFDPKEATRMAELVAELKEYTA
jgi:hypothetical protein